MLLIQGNAAYINPKKITMHINMPKFLSFDLLHFPGSMLHTKYIIIVFFKKMVLLMLRILCILKTEFEMIWAGGIDQ